jgi:hypothetical protein
MLPHTAPAHIALVCDIKRTWEVPTATRIHARPLRSRSAGSSGVSPGQLLLAHGGATLTATWLWMFETLGMLEYIGAPHVQSHQPWEPVPRDPDPTAAPPPSGPACVNAAYGRRWADWVQTDAPAYARVQPQLTDERWVLRGRDTTTRHLYHRARAGALHLHEWHARYGNGSLQCPRCRVGPDAAPLTRIHALTDCIITQPARRVLRATLLAALDSPPRRSPPASPPPADRPVARVHKLVVEGISTSGVLAPRSSARAADLEQWCRFLLGAPASPPAPCSLTPGGDAPSAPKWIRAAFRRIVPHYVGAACRALRAAGVSL